MICHHTTSMRIQRGSLMDDGNSAGDFDPIKVGNLVARLAVDETEMSSAGSAI